MAEQLGFGSLVSGLRDGVVMFDVNWQITLLNPAAAQFTNLAKDFRDLRELLSLFAGVDLNAEVDEVLNGQVTRRVAEAPLGQSTFEIFVLPLSGAQGQLVGGALILHDITQVKEIDRMRRDFMNVAAHDLRTPLTAVKGFVQMIRRGDFGEPPDGEIAGALADVEDGADRMISLVNDFLTVSRIQQGRFKVNAKPTDIESIVKQAVDEVAITAKERPVKVSYTVAQGVPQVQADRSKIVQVLVNLMDNALKHTEEGSITVTVQQFEDPSFVLVSEVNTGDSIPKKDLQHIFEQYYKGAQTEVAPGRGGGLGLGLHIVKMIVEAHGGTIWAESEPGQGAAFHFTLPVAS